MTSASVATAGIIGWIGLVVPHLARALVGPDFARLLPTAAILGGGFLHHLLKVDFGEAVNPAAVDMMGEEGNRGDVRERLTDRARVGRRAKFVLVLGNLLGNLDGVVANGSEFRRKLSAAVVRHKACLQGTAIGNYIQLFEPL